jgi:hypothetical protein
MIWSLLILIDMVGIGAVLAFARMLERGYQVAGVTGKSRSAVLRPCKDGVAKDSLGACPASNVCSLRVQISFGLATLEELIAKGRLVVRGQHRPEPSGFACRYPFV